MNFSKIFISGCGDIGKRIANIARAENINVIATTRSPEKLATLNESGINAIHCNLDDPETLLNLPLKERTVIYLVPPPGGGITDPRVKNFVATIKPDNLPKKLVYISTTAVYGTQDKDKLISENDPTEPDTSRGKRRLDAEKTLLQWGKQHKVQVVILRVSGIYGQGRIPMDKILNRHPLLNSSESGFTNRIHSDDLATVCMAAMGKEENDGEIYNVSDGEISTMTDYFNAITDILSLPRLPQIPLLEARQVMAPLMLSYMTESRKIDNSKMMRELNIRLKYPTLKEGLRASIS